jgi:mitogen-activated protein kinase organizer 1
LISSLDSSIRLLDKQSGELLGEYVVVACSLALSLSLSGHHLTASAWWWIVRRYKGHVNNQYKIASSLTNTDAYVVSGSEDSRICFWDLVEARTSLSLSLEDNTPLHRVPAC